MLKSIPTKPGAVDINQPLKYDDAKFITLNANSSNTVKSVARLHHKLFASISRNRGQLIHTSLFMWPGAGKHYRHFMPFKVMYPKTIPWTRQSNAGCIIQSDGFYSFWKMCTVVPISLFMQQINLYSTSISGTALIKANNYFHFSVSFVFQGMWYFYVDAKGCYFHNLESLAHCKNANESLSIPNDRFQYIKLSGRLLNYFCEVSDVMFAIILTVLLLPRFPLFFEQVQIQSMHLHASCSSRFVYLFQRMFI